MDFIIVCILMVRDTHMTRVGKLGLIYTIHQREWVLKYHNKLKIENDRYRQQGINLPCCSALSCFSKAY